MVEDEQTARKSRRVENSQGRVTVDSGSAGNEYRHQPDEKGRDERPEKGRNGGEPSDQNGYGDPGKESVG